jgi:hypothetical protein
MRPLKAGLAGIFAATFNPSFARCGNLVLWLGQMPQFIAASRWLLVGVILRIYDERDLSEISSGSESAFSIGAICNSGRRKAASNGLRANGREFA